MLIVRHSFVGLGHSNVEGNKEVDDEDAEGRATTIQVVRCDKQSKPQQASFLPVCITSLETQEYKAPAQAGMCSRTLTLPS